MQLVRFDRAADLPIIDVKIFGPRRSHRLKLIFDTGSEFSIIDTRLIEEIRYSAREALRPLSVRGAVGECQEGYEIELRELRLFGKRVENLRVGVFDFEHFMHFTDHWCRATTFPKPGSKKRQRRGLLSPSFQQSTPRIPRRSATLIS